MYIFQLKKTDKMEVLMDKFCQMKGIEKASARYVKIFVRKIKSKRSYDAKFPNPAFLDVLPLFSPPQPSPPPPFR